MAEKKPPGSSSIRRLKKERILQIVDELLTEREQLKQQLNQIRKENAVHWQMFEHAPDALFLMDIHTKIVNRYNQEAARLFDNLGVKIKKGTKATHFLNTLYSKEKLKNISQLLDKSGIWKEEVELKSGQQKSYWADIAIVRLEVEDHIYQLGRINDISQKVETRRELQFSEEKYRKLAERMPGIVYICDMERSKITYLNSKTQDILGFEAEQFLNYEVLFSEIYHPEDSERITATLESALNGSSPYHLEYRLKHKDDSYIWIEDHGVVIERNDELFIQGVMFDASEKKAAEAKLQEQNEHLTRVNAELDSFAYSVSHDLRAPINSAMGLLELLKNDPDSPRRDQFIELSRKSLHKLDDFIQDVINISKNARVDLSVSEIEFAPLIEDILDDLRFESEHEKIDLQMDIRQEHTFVSDPQRVRVVLNNLISNAFRYRDSRKERPFVRVELSSNPKGISCSVIDNGVGIEEKHMGEIFKMFYRAHDHIKGSGLGLYLVQETIERLKGRIEAKSENRKGSTFRFELPNLAKGQNN